MVITKPKEHDINRAGKRLLRNVLEPLGWVVNEVQEDYGIDCNIHVFDGGSPTGAWFHVQLKSSASPAYSADRSFVSQTLAIDHARHYALKLLQPVLLIYADVTSNRICWYAPQLDHRLAVVLANTSAKFITVRIPTHQRIPETAPGLLTSLNLIYLALAGRQLASTPSGAFVASLDHLPERDAFQRALQEKNDSVKLRMIGDLFKERKLPEARSRATLVLADPDSAIEIKFWAQIQLEGIEYAETLHSGRPQDELAKVFLAHSKALQKLTRSGPKNLKFYSLIVRRAAELAVLAHENCTVAMALYQHLQSGGHPGMALSLYVRQVVITRRIVSEYNRCVRLARYAANYPNRRLLGRALTNIVNGIAPFLYTLQWERKTEIEEPFARSALQLNKLAARISEETGDPEGVELAIISALVISRSRDSEEYRWASQIANGFADPEIRANALATLDRAVQRWEGRGVEGDYQGDTLWQITQNIATAMGINLSDENDPLVRGLRIAIKDNSPERVLAQCEHLLVGRGGTGPVARQIFMLFNIGTAGSKVIHCTLHNFHVEGRELDNAYGEFKRAHCDSCPDQRPRPDGWRYTDEERRAVQNRHREFVALLEGTPFGFRNTNED